MRVLGLIPARGGSKGVKRKNIRPLGGRPLLDWTLRVALREPTLADVLVSTEDAEIAAVAREHGGWVPFLRHPETATDTAKSIDVVLECLDRLEEMGRNYDAVCLLQPTAPFRSPLLLRSAQEKFSAGEYTGLISVLPVPAHYHPNWAFIPDADDALVPAQGPGSVIPRRQELPPAYVRDGAVYLTRTATLRAGSFFGERLGYVENRDAARINIDTPEDWARAESLVHQLTL